MVPRILVILGVMVLTYGAAKWKKLSAELGMFLAAVCGGLAGAFAGTPPAAELIRHIVEGSFTYLDIILVFFTATVFMGIVRESGAVGFVVRATITRFARTRVLALLILMVIVLMPGALTGAGSVSLLVVGAPVALALKYLGVSDKKTAAILFILAGLSAAAPPVNIWAMILCAGTAIPYVGFELPLGVPVILLGSFTVLFLGFGRQRTESPQEILTSFPEVPAGMKWWRVLLPFFIFFSLVILYRIFPFSTPLLGLSLEFVMAAAVARLASPRKIDLLVLSRDTVKRLLPLLSTMVIVGMLQQVMTATGVRGLLSYTVISMPLIMLFILLPVIIPFSEGVLTYGGAAVIGIPLIWYLDSIGYHATIVISGLSLLWPLGDGLPPTALIGRLSVMVSDYKASYGSFLKAAWVPWIVITVVGMLMVYFSSRLSFLVKWSM